jgi:hypothetical protein
LRLSPQLDTIQVERQLVDEEIRAKARARLEEGRRAPATLTPNKRGRGRPRSIVRPSDVIDEIESEIEPEIRRSKRQKTVTKRAIGLD